jgi:hypothetical protein
MNLKMLFAPKRSVSSRLAGLLSILMLCKLAYAAGATGPAGFQGLNEVFLQITLYPFIGVALAFLVFKATNKAWAFFLIPFFYLGLSYLAPKFPAPTPEDLPELFASVVAWLYLPVILASAIGYGIYSRTKKAWIFLVVPVLGWILQFLSLIFIINNMNQT